MEVTGGAAVGHTVERGTTVVVAHHVDGPTVATLEPHEPSRRRDRGVDLSERGDEVDVQLVSGNPLDVTIRGERRPARS
jgi:antitoxin (DNA-binding transcriptional repressor) of toxin-antitoxin stability system